MIARREAGDGAATNLRIAEGMDVGEKFVRALRAGDQPLHLGDVHLWPRSVAVEVLERLLADLREGSPRRELLDLTLCLSEAEGLVSREVLEALRDRHVTADERRAIGQRVRKLGELVTALARFCDEESDR